MDLDNIRIDLSLLLSSLLKMNSRYWQLIWEALVTQVGLEDVQKLDNFKTISFMSWKEQDQIYLYLCMLIV